MATSHFYHEATERRWRSIYKAKCCWRIPTGGLQLKLLRLLHNFQKVCSLYYDITMKSCCSNPVAYAGGRTPIHLLLRNNKMSISANI